MGQNYFSKYAKMVKVAPYSNFNGGLMTKHAVATHA